MDVLARSLTLFVLAGLCEIGGGYLVWQWWRNGASWALGALGGLVLFAYGIVPTYQPAHFGRVYADYGGWFVVRSLLWGWGMDRVIPDRYDVLGGALCLAGVGVIMYGHGNLRLGKASAAERRAPEPKLAAAVVLHTS